MLLQGDPRGVQSAAGRPAPSCQKHDPGTRDPAVFALANQRISVQVSFRFAPSPVGRLFCFLRAAVFDVRFFKVGSRAPGVRGEVRGESGWGEAWSGEAGWGEAGWGKAGWGEAR